MRNIFITSVFLFLLMSCSTHNKSNLYSDEENFVLSFKKSVLYGCVDEATNNNLSLFSKENNDLGLAVEVAILQHTEVSIAVEKGKELSKKIRTINYADYEDRKPIFSNCVSFAFSKEIDSIARDLYNKRKEKY